MQTTDIKNNTSLVTFLILLIGVLALSFAMIMPLVPYIILGGILALLTRPLYTFLYLKRRWKRPLAALAVVFLVFLIVAGPVSFFISRAAEQGVALAQKLGSNGSLHLDTVVTKIQSLRFAHAIFPNPAETEDRVRSYLQTGAKTVSGVLVAQVAALPTIILHSVIALMTCYFFLTDGGRFVRWFADKIPLDQDVRIRLIDSFKNTSVSVIWATVAAAAAQSAVILAGFLILGLPAAFLAAGLTFVFAWIPIVGSSPVWIAGCIYLALKGAWAKTVILAVIGLFAGIVDNIVRPMVLKGRSDMHPVVALIAVFGGIRMFGILGIFFGPIVAALAISLLQVWPVVGNRSGLSFGLTTDEIEAAGVEPPPSPS